LNKHRYVRRFLLSNLAAAEHDRHIRGLSWLCAIDDKRKTHEQALLGKKGANNTEPRNQLVLLFGRLVGGSM